MIKLKLFTAILILFSSTYLSAQQLNSPKLDVPYYSMYDFETNELVIAGCRFNYLYDKSMMFIAKLDASGNVTFVKDFEMQDTCIIHIGGLFKEDDGWRVFFTGMADSPYYAANAWGYFKLDNSLQNITKTQWYPTHNSALKLSFMKAVQHNKTTYYGTNHAEKWERAINSSGKPFYWVISNDSLSYSYNDSSAFTGDLTSINDSLLFSISIENYALVFKWHDIKNKHVLTMPYGAIKSNNTNITGVPSVNFRFADKHELIKSFNNGFVLASSIHEEFDNPNNINLDSIFNPNTAQFLIAKFNLPIPIFSNDSVYLNRSIPEIITPTTHCITDSRNPEPIEFVNYSYNSSKISRTQSIAFHNGNYYFLRSYDGNLMMSHDLGKSVFKLSCFDSQLKLRWEKTLIYDTGGVLFSIVTKTNGCFIVAANGTGKSIIDTIWRWTYSECDIKIYSFDSTGFSTAVNEVNLAQQAHQITIYPNPSSNIINIKGIDAKSTISIFNITGTQINIPETRNNQIDISHLTNGIYFVKIVTANNTIIKKFIKH